MELKLSISEDLTPVSLEKIAAFIISLQKENGEIPWSVGGKTDPWDHVERAMFFGLLFSELPSFLTC